MMVEFHDTRPWPELSNLGEIESSAPVELRRAAKAAPIMRPNVCRRPARGTPKAVLAVLRHEKLARKAARRAADHAKRNAPDAVRRALRLVAPGSPATQVHAHRREIARRSRQEGKV